MAATAVPITEILNLFEVQSPKGSDASQAAQVRRLRRLHHRGQWKPFQDAEKTQGHPEVVAPPTPFLVKHGHGLPVVFHGKMVLEWLQLGCPANEDGVI